MTIEINEFGEVVQGNRRIAASYPIAKIGFLKKELVLFGGGPGEVRWKVGTQVEVISETADYQGVELSTVQLPSGSCVTVEADEYL